MSPIRTLTLLLATASAAALNDAPARAQASAGRPVLEMRPCRPSMSNREVRCGTYHAPENRDVSGGRTIPLDVIVIPARGPDPRPDPIFYFVGGPGQTATEAVSGADDFRWANGTTWCWWTSAAPARRTRSTAAREPAGLLAFELSCHIRSGKRQLIS
jgi:hypothetical protein